MSTNRTIIYRTFAILVLLALCGTASAKSRPSIAELESSLDAIDAELETLAHYSHPTGVGGIGFRSQKALSPESQGWVEIDLQTEAVIDQIVLAPVLWRDTLLGFRADGFPEAFRIRVGTMADSEGMIVAEFGTDDALLPRAAPLVIPITPIPASWVRLEVSRLSSWAIEPGTYVFELSEIFVFAGQENLSLRKPVKLSWDVDDSAGWRREFLVDGVAPYLMNVPRGASSMASSSDLLDTDQGPFRVDIDLGEVRTISQLNLHAVEQGDTSPQSFPGDFGIPHRFKLEGATHSDFSDARTLLDVSMASIYEKSPIMRWGFPETACRYVRFVVVDPYIHSWLDHSGGRIGFAEIEIISNGENVTVGKIPQGDFMLSSSQHSFSKFTDGLNLYGLILSTRDWMDELGRRHDLEVKRPQVTEALRVAYSNQQERNRLLVWSVVFLVFGIVLLVLFSRIITMRQEVRIRERIAANLHDELGANLHAIGLLGDMAQKFLKFPERLSETVARIRLLTEETGASARRCSHMLSSKDVSEDLVEQMKQDASRLLCDLEHDLLFVGEAFLDELSHRRRIDLILFYKECLSNIIQHSGATKVVTRVVGTEREIELTVTDNGHGYEGSIPYSLKRRARFLGTRAVFVEQNETGGTRVRLKLKIRKIGFQK